jgi:hypothetical protein
VLLSLKDCAKAEFVALYGRRRVGKTFLINQLFGDNLVFKMTGVFNGSLKEQLMAFTIPWKISVTQWTKSRRIG